MTALLIGRKIFWFAVCAAALFLAGCGDERPTLGGDSVYLNAPLKGDKPSDRSARLLPLAPGDFWEMASYCQGTKSNDRLVVVGPVNIGGVTGTLINHLREGNLWRKEVYRETDKELQLVAAQDETSGLMRFSPPLPLLKYPTNDGDYAEWSGRFIMDKANFPARSFSRFSGREKVRTPAGVFDTIRIDTVLIVTQPGGEIRFPSIRWLSPGVGFVRRGFADRSRPAYSEVLKFNPQ